MRGLLCGTSGHKPVSKSVLAAVKARLIELARPL
jgi:hypothetical protein